MVMYTKEDMERNRRNVTISAEAFGPRKTWGPARPWAPQDLGVIMRSLPTAGERLAHFRIVLLYSSITAHHQFLKRDARREYCTIKEHT